MSRLMIAVDQIDAARRYTRLVLAHTPTQRWLDAPAGESSNVAWQVGHMAWAQAGLALGKVCNRSATDIVPGVYGELFGKGSKPRADAADYPAPAELIGVMKTVHERVMAELPKLAEGAMDEPATHATGLIHDKFGLLMWVARHEMLHVGQIGLIRRCLGLAPYR